MNADATNKRTEALTFLSTAAVVRMGKWFKRAFQKVLCLTELSVPLSGDISSTLFHPYINLLESEADIEITVFPINVKQDVVKYMWHTVKNTVMLYPFISL